MISLCYVVLQRVLQNGFRPHRSLGLKPPNGRMPIETWEGMQPITVTRRDRLGGLLCEYERAA